MHKLIYFIWLGIKAGVTIVSVVGGFFIFFVMAQSTGLNQPRPWMILALSMFIAAVPWVFFEFKETRMFAATILFIGLCLIAFALTVPYVPKNCATSSTSKSRLGCDLFNSLHNLGGSNLVAAFWVAIGCLFLYGGYKLYKKHA
jgi:hypothetical protein